jgi:[ribosomal protein S18]-alanine N-acetyltransferase
MTGILVRPVEPEDLPALTALERAAFPEDPWSRRALADELAPTSLFDAFQLAACPRDDPGRIVGYAAFRHVLDEGELLRLAVWPKARGTGIGRHLLEAGLDRLARRGVRRCLLEVRRGNAAALALYERLGFVPVGERRGYYGDGTDALLYRRDLRPVRPHPSHGTSGGG